MHGHSSKYNFTELPPGMVAVIENARKYFRQRSDVTETSIFVPNVRRRGWYSASRRWIHVSTGPHGPVVDLAIASKSIHPFSPASLRPACRDCTEQAKEAASRPLWRFAALHAWEIAPVGLLITVIRIAVRCVVAGVGSRRELLIQHRPY